MREIAYAKINLALHVRRRRADGYHDIETVFAFCEDGDVLEAEPADRLSLSVEGPFAAGLQGDDNLVLRAARALGVVAALRLAKNLPVAAGLGGGSADAAAALRLFASHDVDPGFCRSDDIGDGESLRLAELLGADVPACLASMTARGEGTGTDLTPVAAVTGMPVLLVNPRLPLSTAAVFEAWDGVDRGPLGDWREGRNDLEAPAKSLLPVIGDVLAWLRDRPGANCVRMSGSGATCFALFDDVSCRDTAAKAVPAQWWHMASRLR